MAQSSLKITPKTSYKLTKEDIRIINKYEMPNH